MKVVFNPVFITENKVAFWILVVLIIIMMLLTLYFVVKELKKK